MTSSLDFAPSEVKKFDTKARDVIAVAMMLDWRLRWTNNQHKSLTLRSPAGTKTIVIPTTNVNAKRASAWLSQIATHTPDLAQTLATGSGLDLLTADPDVQRVTALVGTAFIERMRDLAREKGIMAAAPEQQHLTQKVAEAVPQPLPDEVVIKAPKSMPVTVESREPMVIPRSGGGSDGPNSHYTSKVIEVITYSDSTVEYGCAFCDYISSNHRSVSSHSAGRHPGQGTPDWLITQHEREKAAVSTPVPTPPPVPAGPVTPKSGLPLLTHHLRLAMAKHDQARDVSVMLAELDYETRARLAQALLVGKDDNSVVVAETERAIREANDERDLAIMERDELVQWRDSLQAMLGVKPPTPQL